MGIYDGVGIHDGGVVAGDVVGVRLGIVVGANVDGCAVATVGVIVGIYDVGPVVEKTLGEILGILGTAVGVNDGRVVEGRTVGVGVGPYVPLTVTLRIRLLETSAMYTLPRKDRKCQIKT